MSKKENGLMWEGAFYALVEYGGGDECERCDLRDACVHTPCMWFVDQVGPCYFELQ